jgi:hypothetical protein
MGGENQRGISTPIRANSAIAQCTGKPSYLKPNSSRMHKPIEGLSSHRLNTLNKGERVSTRAQQFSFLQRCLIAQKYSDTSLLFCEQSVYATNNCLNPLSSTFNTKMSNQHPPTSLFYSNTMESYLSIIMRNHATRRLWRKLEWQNVQNVEPKSPSRGRPGKWQDDQTNKENACNWKSDFTTAQKITAHSEKS